MRVERGLVPSGPHSIALSDHGLSTVVEQTPADVIAGRDPQLEKAIEVVMQQLEANPPRKLVRPPFPTRAVRD